MTQEEKELLLKDLCCRLPYGVFVEYDYGDGVKRATKFHGNYLYLMMMGSLQWKDFKPYLRPMSSMTEAERRTYTTLRAHALPFTIVAWLDENMFDHRTTSEGEHLIESGLALEAPEGMYFDKRHILSASDRGIIDEIKKIVNNSAELYKNDYTREINFLDKIREL